MMDELGKFDVQRQLANLADWSDRIAKGELPKSDPARPTGKSRDVVVTEWDWANEHIYLHDTIATDKRTPTLNSNGLIYGAPEASSDLVPWLDPIDNKAGFIKSEYRDANTPTTEEQQRCSRRLHIGATSRSGTATRTSTIRCSTRRGACG